MFTVAGNYKYKERDSMINFVESSGAPSCVSNKRDYKNPF